MQGQYSICECHRKELEILIWSIVREHPTLLFSCCDLGGGNEVGLELKSRAAKAATVSTHPTKSVPRPRRQNLRGGYRVLMSSSSLVLQP